MEYLVLPIAIIAIIVVGAISAYVADNPERKERVWKVFAATLATVILTAALSVLFGCVWYGCARAEEESVVVEYTPDEYLIEAASKNEILIKVPYEGKWLSLYWDTTDESFKPIKIWVKIVNGESCVEADYAEEEPEPIGFFPPFFLLAIAPSTGKKFKRAQKMPPDFYLPCNPFDKNTYIVYFVEKQKYFVKLELNEALKKLISAEKKEIPAFVCCFVEAYKQQAVIACNYIGFLEYWRNTAISDKIRVANETVFQTIPPATSNKEDPGNIGVLKRTPASGVLTEEEMAETQKTVNNLKLRQF